MLECDSLLAEVLKIQRVYFYRRTEHGRASGIIGNSVIHSTASSPLIRDTVCIKTLPRT
jgi:hypothetical protein